MPGPRGVPVEPARLRSRTLYGFLVVPDVEFVQPRLCGLVADRHRAVLVVLDLRVVRLARGRQYRRC